MMCFPMVFVHCIKDSTRQLFYIRGVEYRPVWNVSAEGKYNIN